VQQGRHFDHLFPAAYPAGAAFETAAPVRAAT
jgi:hypothetical protein